MVINQKKNTFILIPMIVILGAIGFFAPFFHLTMKLATDTCEAAQRINRAQATPVIVFVNQPTPVTITAEIEPDPDLVSSSVTLVECNARGKPINNLGKLYNNADPKSTLSGPGIFTKEIMVNKGEPVILHFRVSVPYKGVLPNLLSDVFTVRVEATPER